MDGLSEFLSMGGYAAFVWPAYAVVVVVLVAVYVASARSLRARELDVEKAEASSPRRERP